MTDTKEKTRRPRATGELFALAKIGELLGDLDEEARVRVLRYHADRNDLVLTPKDDGEE